MTIRVIAIACVTLFSGTALAQVQDGFGKEWSPIQIEKGKKQGQAAVEEAKAKAEQACKTTFALSLDWKAFDPSTYKQRRFEPYHIGLRCGDAFEALRYICGRSLEARKNVQATVKAVSCSLHPGYLPIMKWRKDNQVDADERATLLKDDPKKFEEWFRSDCVTGARISPDKHILCSLEDQTLAIRYSVWSVNLGSEVQGFLKKYFAE